MSNILRPLNRVDRPASDSLTDAESISDAKNSGIPIVGSNQKKKAGDRRSSTVLKKKVAEQVTAIVTRRQPKSPLHEIPTRRSSPETTFNEMSMSLGEPASELHSLQQKIERGESLFPRSSLNDIQTKWVQAWANQLLSDSWLNQSETWIMAFSSMPDTIHPLVLYAAALDMIEFEWVRDMIYTVPVPSGLAGSDIVIHCMQCGAVGQQPNPNHFGDDKDKNEALGLFVRSILRVSYEIRSDERYKALQLEPLVWKGWLATYDSLCAPYESTTMMDVIRTKWATQFRNSSKEWEPWLCQSPRVPAGGDILWRPEMSSSLKLNLSKRGLDDAFPQISAKIQRTNSISFPALVDEILDQWASDRKRMGTLMLKWKSEQLNLQPCPEQATESSYPQPGPSTPRYPQSLTIPRPRDTPTAPKMRQVVRKYQLESKMAAWQDRVVCLLRSDIVALKKFLVAQAPPLLKQTITSLVHMTHGFNTIETCPASITVFLLFGPSVWNAFVRMHSNNCEEAVLYYSRLFENVNGALETVTTSAEAYQSWVREWT
nr:TPA_asm: hypothetical protein [Triaenorhabdovirus 1]